MGESSKARILIIDDEELSNQILANLLGEHFEVDIALNLDEAETFLSNDPPDLILLDAVLPGECGISYLKQIKTRDPRLRVIVVTGRLDAETKDKALQAGAIEVIHKPIDISEFMTSSNRSCDNRNPPG